jgi:hypothetical protein
MRTGNEDRAGKRNLGFISSKSLSRLEMFDIGSLSVVALEQGGNENEYVE